MLFERFPGTSATSKTAQVVLTFKHPKAESFGILHTTNKTSKTRGGCSKSKQLAGSIVWGERSLDDDYEDDDDDDG